MIHHFIALLIIHTLFIHSINADSFQAKHIPTNTQDNFVTHLQKELQAPEYRREILPNDFSSLSQLITFGTTNNQSSTYLVSVFKMFSNILKGSQYSNACAFSALLTDFSTILHPYFSLPVATTYITDEALYDASFADRFKSTIYTNLYSEFSTKYCEFRQDPNQFLQNISNNIFALAQEEMEQEHMRQAIIRFCEIALSKLVWDPRDQEKTWHMTKKIAEQLTVLLEQNILDDAHQLDDLFWTLVTRYCYFIEIAATDLTEECYDAIKKDISSQKIVLFELSEQDFIVESKLSYMQRTLIESQIKNYGVQRDSLGD